ncbi:MAG: GNAT family N-acetyltransferase, partial [Candidatus Lokiarchaeota archaeon]|nr:GNAT family N-acetyltransferase [Candidatus Lokiarchaeota archaeon]
VLEEGEYLPVLTPVKSDFEKNSWYQTIREEHEICLVAEVKKYDPPYNIVGQCEISNLEWEAASHVGTLGIIVKREYRDMGIGKELIDAAIWEAKKLNNKEKIILSCFSTNKRARHLYKKMGFNEVGVRKKQFYMNSTYYDELMMELWIDDYLAASKS